MGNRDYWPYDRHYWKNWAEHNNHYWNNLQAHRYARHCGRGRMLGALIIFGIGYCVGSHVNQRYHMPAGYPREAWEEMKAAAENLRKDHPTFHDSSEFREIIEKMKDLEKRFRRQPPTDGSQPSTSAPSAPSSSD